MDKTSIVGEINPILEFVFSPVYFSYIILLFTTIFATMKWEVFPEKRFKKIFPIWGKISEYVNAVILGMIGCG
jgi:hypothetical protein